MKKDGRIFAIYRTLLAKHGQQGWWPVGGKYHPCDYSYPKTDAQRFEICVGAMLAQNISWKGAGKAVANLHKAGTVDAGKMLKLPLAKLRHAIRPAGYFNQKARKLRVFAKFYRGLRGRMPSREELLSLWGVGPETADSILLYAYNAPSFVVDAYTRRLFGGYGILSGAEKYDEIKKLFEENLPRNAKLYNEYHAVIVAEAKYSFKNNDVRRAYKKGNDRGNR